MKIVLPLFGLLSLVISACSGHQQMAHERDIPPGGWTAKHQRDHPLVGRWFDVRAGQFTTSVAVRQASAQAEILLLGEKHDNPDHHNLQAGFVAAGNAGDIVLLEMLVQSQQDAATRLTKGMSPADISKHLDWDKNWNPSIGIYAPILVAALDRDMLIRPANASRKRVRATMTQGLSGESPAFVRRWTLDQPLPNGKQAGLLQEIRDVHCGYLPEKHVPAMAMAQRLRDAAMAASVADAVPARSNGRRIVIAGNGHVRNDRAIPALLKAAVPDRIMSVGFVEVQEDLRDATNYTSLWGTESLPFDYILFTPVVDPADPCEKFRHQFNKKPG